MWIKWSRAENCNKHCDISAFTFWIKKKNTAMQICSTLYNSSIQHGPDSMCGQVIKFANVAVVMFHVRDLNTPCFLNNAKTFIHQMHHTIITLYTWKYDVWIPAVTFVQRKKHHFLFNICWSCRGADQIMEPEIRQLHLLSLLFVKDIKFCFMQKAFSGSVLMGCYCYS